jgi:TPR repeat protein
VRAANRGNASSQAELGIFHFASAKSTKRLDILHRTPADDDTVASRWGEALRFLEGAAEQGVASAQSRCGDIYAAGGRSVPQNWATAVKWWRKAAEAGDKSAQWHMGLCYYYGRGVDRDAAQAMPWFRKAAAQGNAQAAQAVQAGIPGEAVRELVLARFTNAGSAPLRHEVAHEFAGPIVNDKFLEPRLQAANRVLSRICRAASIRAFQHVGGVHDGFWHLRRGTRACQTDLRLRPEDVHILRLQLCSAPKLLAVHGAALLHRYRVPARGLEQDPGSGVSQCSVPLHLCAREQGEDAPGVIV